MNEATGERRAPVPGRRRTDRLAGPVHAAFEAVLLLSMCLLTLATIASSIAGFLGTRAVGALVAEIRQDRKDVTVLRARLLEAEDRQGASLEHLERALSRVAATICDHMTDIRRPHRGCPP